MGLVTRCGALESPHWDAGGIGISLAGFDWIHYDCWVCIHGQKKLKWRDENMTSKISKSQSLTEWYILPSLNIFILVYRFINAFFFEHVFVLQNVQQPVVVLASRNVCLISSWWILFLWPDQHLSLILCLQNSQFLVTCPVAPISSCLPKTYFSLHIHTIFFGQYLVCLTYVHCFQPRFKTGELSLLW